MQEDVVGPLKELRGEKKARYTTCARCGKPLLREEARPGQLSRGAPPDEKVETREELCPDCHEDYLKNELLPAEEERER